jgi:phosphosulfolactate phosphohydrolase-like enzyme
MYRVPFFNLKTAWKKVQQKSYKGHKVIDRDVKYCEKKIVAKILPATKNAVFFLQTSNLTPST